MGHETRNSPTYLDLDHNLNIILSAMLRSLEYLAEIFKSTMRLSHPLLLASCASAIQHRALLKPADSCLWRPPPPRLACAIDEWGDNPSGANTTTAFQKKASGRSQQRTHETLPPSKWEATHHCAGPYCIFTNPGFAHGRGMVAITTSPTLPKLRAIEPSRPVPASYHLSLVPGKGLGMIANQTLSRGAVVTTESPAVLIHRGFLETIPAAEQHPLLDQAITHLPPPLRAAFLAQMGHFGGHRVADILATNSFQMDLGGADGHHYGNFPAVSRFNHDCRPNVAFRVAGGGLVHTTTVVRDVAPGEELAISYLDSFESRERRRQRAKMAWGFECACSQCSLGEEAVRRSDARLEEIRRVEGVLGDFQSTGVDAALLRKLVKLYRDERLDAGVAGAYTLVALSYNMLGDARLAVKYAKLAREAVIIERGPEAGDAEAMRELAEAPKEHFTWKARVQR
ncbi:hypothetical protein B0H67DRAFT_566710 [Lasiosphaeris hirsuta]|uniref:SET domain-containing protein n=1 Tax=Lasiosphaeris hirsuta TaxID=260670 RepID=A0AA40BD76_9PEZI|nr:hypothetical protein B0H67DRAFT_566710 [Lasiosphaeris hirsuta]